MKKIILIGVLFITSCLQATQELEFNFKPFKEADLPLMFEWLSLPHVSQWWREPKEYDVFYERYVGYIKQGLMPYFICHLEKPIGFISCYNVLDDPLRNEGYPDPTYGFDVLIADADYLGKGHGAEIVKQFLRKILIPMKPKKIIIDPEIINTKAIHVCEKAGFKKRELVQMNNGVELVTAQLMELDVESL